MSALPSGTCFGPYEILGLIGAGGMGDVYRARDTRLDRIVALKVSKEEFTPRFETEARATAALEHPHICRLYEVCHQDGVSFLVMEYVEGTPLEPEGAPPPPHPSQSCSTGRRCWRDDPTNEPPRH